VTLQTQAKFYLLPDPPNHPTTESWTWGMVREQAEKILNGEETPGQAALNLTRYGGTGGLLAPPLLQELHQALHQTATPAQICVLEDIRTHLSFGTPSWDASYQTFCNSLVRYWLTVRNEAPGEAGLKNARVGLNRIVTMIPGLAPGMTKALREIARKENTWVVDTPTSSVEVESLAEIVETRWGTFEPEHFEIWESQRFTQVKGEEILNLAKQKSHPGLYDLHEELHHHVQEGVQNKTLTLEEAAALVDQHTESWGKDNAFLQSQIWNLFRVTSTKEVDQPILKQTETFGPYWKNHGRFPLVWDKENPEVDPAHVQAMNLARMSGDELELQVRKYSQEQVKKVIDSLNQMARVHWGWSVPAYRVKKYLEKNFIPGIPGLDAYEVADTVAQIWVGMIYDGIATEEQIATLVGQKLKAYPHLKQPFLEAFRKVSSGRAPKRKAFAKNLEQAVESLQISQDPQPSNQESEVEKKNREKVHKRSLVQILLTPLQGKSLNLGEIRALQHLLLTEGGRTLQDRSDQWLAILSGAHNPYERASEPNRGEKTPTEIAHLWIEFCLNTQICDHVFLEPLKQWVGSRAVDEVLPSWAWLLNKKFGDEDPQLNVILDKLSTLVASGALSLSEGREILRVVRTTKCVVPWWGDSATPTVTPEAYSDAWLALCSILPANRKVPEILHAKELEARVSPGIGLLAFDRWRKAKEKGEGVVKDTKPVLSGVQLGYIKKVCARVAKDQIGMTEALEALVTFFRTGEDTLGQSFASGWIDPADLSQIWLTLLGREEVREYTGGSLFFTELKQWLGSSGTREIVAKALGATITHPIPPGSSKPRVFTPQGARIQETPKGPAVAGLGPDADANPTSLETQVEKPQKTNEMEVPATWKPKTWTTLSESQILYLRNSTVLSAKASLRSEAELERVAKDWVACLSSEDFSGDFPPVSFALLGLRPEDMAEAWWRISQHPTVKAVTNGEIFYDLLAEWVGKEHADRIAERVKPERKSVWLEKKTKIFQSLAEGLATKAISLGEARYLWRRGQESDFSVSWVPWGGVKATHGDLATAAFALCSETGPEANTDELEIGAWLGYSMARMGKDTWEKRKPLQREMTRAEEEVLQDLATWVALGKQSPFQAVVTWEGVMSGDIVYPSSRAGKPEVLGLTRLQVANQWLTILKLSSCYGYHEGALERWVGTEPYRASTREFYQRNFKDKPAPTVDQKQESKKEKKSQWVLTVGDEEYLKNVCVLTHRGYISWAQAVEALKDRFTGHPHAQYPVVQDHERVIPEQLGKTWLALLAEPSLKEVTGGDRCLRHLREWLGFECNLWWKGNLSESLCESLKYLSLDLMRRKDLEGSVEKWLNCLRDKDLYSQHARAELPHHKAEVARSWYQLVNHPKVRIHTGYFGNYESQLEEWLGVDASLEGFDLWASEMANQPLGDSEIKSLLDLSISVADGDLTEGDAVVLWERVLGGTLAFEHPERFEAPKDSERTNQVTKAWMGIVQKTSPSKGTARAGHETGYAKELLRCFVGSGDVPLTVEAPKDSPEKESKREQHSTLTEAQYQAMKIACLALRNGTTKSYVLNDLKKRFTSIEIDPINLKDHHLVLDEGVAAAWYEIITDPALAEYIQAAGGPSGPVPQDGGTAFTWERSYTWELVQWVGVEVAQKGLTQWREKRGKSQEPEVPEGSMIRKTEVNEGTEAKTLTVGEDAAKVAVSAFVGAAQSPKEGDLYPKDPQYLKYISVKIASGQRTLLEGVKLWNFRGSSPPEIFDHGLTNEKIAVAWLELVNHPLTFGSHSGQTHLQYLKEWLADPETIDRIAKNYPKTVKAADFPWPSPEGTEVTRETFSLAVVQYWVRLLAEGEKTPDHVYQKVQMTLKTFPELAWSLAVALRRWGSGTFTPGSEICLGILENTPLGNITSDASEKSWPYAPGAFQVIKDLGEVQKIHEAEPTALPSLSQEGVALLRLLSKMVATGRMTLPKAREELARFKAWEKKPQPKKGFREEFESNPSLWGVTPGACAEAWVGLLEKARGKHDVGIEAKGLFEWVGIAKTGYEGSGSLSSAQRNVLKVLSIMAARGISLEELHPALDATLSGKWVGDPLPKNLHEKLWGFPVSEQSNWETPCAKAWREIVDGDTSDYAPYGKEWLGEEAWSNGDPGPYREFFGSGYASNFRSPQQTPTPKAIRDFLKILPSMGNLSMPTAHPWANGGIQLIDSPLCLYIPPEGLPDEELEQWKDNSKHFWEAEQKTARENLQTLSILLAKKEIDVVGAIHRWDRRIGYLVKNSEVTAEETAVACLQILAHPFWRMGFLEEGPEEFLRNWLGEEVTQRALQRIDRWSSEQWPLGERHATQEQATRLILNRILSHLFNKSVSLSEAARQLEYVIQSQPHLASYFVDEMEAMVRNRSRGAAFGKFVLEKTPLREVAKTASPDPFGVPKEKCFSIMREMEKYAKEGTLLQEQATEPGTATETSAKPSVKARTDLQPDLQETVRALQEFTILNTWVGISPPEVTQEEAFTQLHNLLRNYGKVSRGLQCINCDFMRIEVPTGGVSKEWLEWAKTQITMAKDAKLDAAMAFVRILQQSTTLREEPENLEPRVKAVDDALKNCPSKVREWVYDLLGGPGLLPLRWHCDSFREFRMEGFPKKVPCEKVLTRLVPCLEGYESVPGVLTHERGKWVATNTHGFVIPSDGLFQTELDHLLHDITKDYAQREAHVIQELAKIIHNYENGQPLQDAVIEVDELIDSGTEFERKTAVGWLTSPNATTVVKEIWEWTACYAELTAKKESPKNLKENNTVKAHSLWEIVRSDAKEIAFRNGVDRIRQTLLDRLVTFWAQKNKPKGLFETEDAYRERLKTEQTKLGAFFQTEAGQGLVSYLAGFTFTLLQEYVPEEVREYGERVAREVRIQGGTDLLDGFLVEVLMPMLGTLKDLAVETFTPRVRVQVEGPKVEAPRTDGRDSEIALLKAKIEALESQEVGVTSWGLRGQA
jgi:hypothetical protein